MKLYLTKHRNGTTREITDLAASWTWSGDKASICRQLDLEIAFLEGSDLPVPEIGDISSWSPWATTTRELASNPDRKPFIRPRG